jgi:hypothetical protein
MNQKHIDTRHPQTKLTGGTPATTGDQGNTPANTINPQTAGEMSKSAIPDGDGISSIDSGKTAANKA